jgi:hypothetical protein
VEEEEEEEEAPSFPPLDDVVEYNDEGGAQMAFAGELSTRLFIFANRSASQTKSVTEIANSMGRKYQDKLVSGKLLAPHNFLRHTAFLSDSSLASLMASLLSSSRSLSLCFRLPSQ